MFRFYEGLPPLLEQFPLGLAVCSDDETILDLNPEFCRILRISPSSTPPQPLSSFAAPEHRELFKKHLQKALTSGRLGPTELDLCTADGAKVPVRIYNYSFSKVGGSFIWTICEDISDEREMLAKLFENEERLQLAVDGGELGIWDWNIETNEVSFSSGWAKQLGFQLSEITPNIESWEALSHPEDRAAVWEKPEEHFAGVLEAHEVEHRMRHKDGSWRWILARGKVIERGPLGKPLRMVGIHIDVTAQRQAAEALKEAQAAAEIAVRAKTEFIANVSHEIRTPLNGITGAGQLLLDTGLTPQQRELVRILQTSSSALLAVVNDILDLSRAEHGKLDLLPTPASFEKCISDTLEILKQRYTEKQIQAEVILDPRLHELHLFDAARLRQILLNLLGNAGKFTPSGGRITVSVNVRAQSDSETIAVFSIHDTGIGIPSEALESIFEPFNQVDSTRGRTFGGSGLGLTICQRLLGLMGSSLSVQSTVGVGSTFTFTLTVPRFRKEELGNSDPVVIPPTAAKARRILVVEDNLVNQRVCRFILQGSGASVTVVSDGAEAIDRLRHEEFDLVLLDLHLPEMDGYEVAAGLRQIERGAGRRTPIIAVSADVLPGVKERCLASGMDSYISKPFDRALLLLEIDRLCQR